MKLAVIGASGKTGVEVVHLALERGHETVAVCRDSSAGKLDEFAGREGFTMLTAPVISDRALLGEALAGCGGVVTVPISVRRLKATELVAALAEAGASEGVARFVFTAGEMTVPPEPGEKTTFRQKLMLPGFSLLILLTPYSLRDMRRASAMVRRQADWDWTIVRAPTLTMGDPAGYRLCELSDIAAKHKLARKDYAACLIDVLSDPAHARRTLTVASGTPGD